MNNTDLLDRVRRSLRVIALLAPIISACSPTVAQYASYAGTEDDKALWAAIEPGMRIAIFDPSSRCDAQIADDDGSLDTRARRVGETDWGKKVTVWTVTAAHVLTAHDVTYVVVNLKGAEQEERTLRFPLQGQSANCRCIWRATPAIVEALKLVGQRRAYAPWNPECVRVEAAGSGTGLLLTKGDSASDYTIEAVEIGSSSAQKLLDWNGSDARVLWFRTNSGALHIQADTVRACFAEGAKPPISILALVHTPLGRCEADHSFVTCNSSLGVWEGEASDHAVSLRLVRRTLGPLHLQDGKPVTSERFARTVVAINMGKPHDGREATIYATMQEGVQSVLSDGDGSVRFVPVSDPDVTLPIHVAVRNVVIGSLVQHATMEQSKYEDHKETRPNPDLRKARSAVTEAESQVREATESYNSRRQLENAAYDGCLNVCDGSFASNPTGRSICRSACKIGGSVADIVDNDSGVQQARAEAEAAKNALESIAPTVEVPIEAEWSYSKTIYERSVSAMLDIDAQFASGPQHWSKELSSSVRDYDIASDVRHNVEGHRVSQEIIDRPESAIPQIGTLIAHEVSEQIRAGINHERQERAEMAFALAGHEAGAVEDRAVDATAFDVVGGRLLQAQRHGDANVVGGKDAYAIPIDVPSMSCLLAVAVAGDAEAQITLSTPDGTHADLRGQSAAVVEMCPGETEPLTRVINLSANKPIQARWGLYSTSPALAK